MTHYPRSTLLVLLAVALATPACDSSSKSSKKHQVTKDDEADDDAPKKKSKKQGADDTSGDDAKPSKKADGSKPAATATGAVAPAAPNDVTIPNVGTYEEPVTTPSKQTYSMVGITTISDDCATAHVIMATAPESVGADYEWKYTRQAMLANQQYRVVADAPHVRGEVAFEVHQADASLNHAFVLLANCADGLTCNHLAAMYKSVVKSSNPQVVCGDVPAARVGRFVKKTDLMAGGPKANLPASSDTISKCARVAACTIADDTATKDDVGIACQKSPSSFRLDCASRYPCAEVLACMK